VGSSLSPRRWRDPSSCDGWGWHGARSWAAGKGVGNKDGHLAIGGGCNGGSFGRQGVARCQVASCGDEVWLVVASVPPHPCFALMVSLAFRWPS
jgi:hypothetical protein